MIDTPNLEKGSGPHNPRRYPQPYSPTPDGRMVRRSVVTVVAAATVVPSFRRSVVATFRRSVAAAVTVTTALNATYLVTSP